MLEERIREAARKFDSRSDDVKVSAAVELGRRALEIYDATAPDEIRESDKNPHEDTEATIDGTSKTSVTLFLLAVRALVVVRLPPIVQYGGEMMLVSRSLIDGVCQRLERRDEVFVAEYLRQVGKMSSSV